MKFCKDCSAKMIGVISFSKDKSEKFCKCPSCFSETKHRKISNKELTFGEVLERTMKNK